MNERKQKKGRKRINEREIRKEKSGRNERKRKKSKKRLNE